MRDAFLPVVGAGNASAAQKPHSQSSIHAQQQQQRLKTQQRLFGATPATSTQQTSTFISPYAGTTAGKRSLPPSEGRSNGYGLPTVVGAQNYSYHPQNHQGSANYTRQLQNSGDTSSIPPDNQQPHQYHHLFQPYAHLGTNGQGLPPINVHHVSPQSSQHPQQSHQPHQLHQQQEQQRQRPFSTTHGKLPQINNTTNYVLMQQQLHQYHQQEQQQIVARQAQHHGRSFRSHLMSQKQISEQLELQLRNSSQPPPPAIHIQIRRATQADATSGSSDGDSVADMASSATQQHPRYSTSLSSTCSTSSTTLKSPIVTATGTNAHSPGRKISLYLDNRPRNVDGTPVTEKPESSSPRLSVAGLPPLLRASASRGGGVDSGRSSVVTVKYSTFLSDFVAESQERDVVSIDGVGFGGGNSALGGKHIVVLGSQEADGAVASTVAGIESPYSRMIHNKDVGSVAGSGLRGGGAGAGDGGFVLPSLSLGKQKKM